MSTDVTPFAFKMTHPVMYAQTIIIQGSDYAEAAGYAQQHIAGTEWTIAKVTNMTTGLAVQNA